MTFTIAKKDANESVDDQSFLRLSAQKNKHLI